MADKSKIEWTDASWNPVAGCSIVSPGCTNCYAMRQANRLLDKPGSHYRGTTKKVKGNAVWTGKLALAPDHILTLPLRWKSPRRVFVNSMSDLFHEDAPDYWIDQVFAIMAMCPQHSFQVLTKRAARMREYLADGQQPSRVVRVGNQLLALCDRLKRRDLVQVMVQADGRTDGWPLPNVWLGVSVEDQARANDRIPHLLRTPAAMRFLSCEPLLGELDLLPFFYDAAAGETIDWVIAGGESGRGARPMHPDWARKTRDQCQLSGVPFFFKQWGEWAPGECSNRPATRTEQVADWWNDGWKYGTLTPRQSEETHRDEEPDVFRLGKRDAGRLLDGVEHNGFPEII